MFDNIISNKYFVIALIIALVVILYLYSQKQSCNVETMKNVDYAPISQEFNERPWAANGDTGDYAPVKKKKRTKGALKRTDQLFGNYMACEKEGDLYAEKNKELPQPLDTTNPGLLNNFNIGKCPPCVCPTNSSDSDSEEPVPKKKKSKKTTRAT